MQSVTVASFNLHWGHRPRSYKPYDLVAACRQLDADVLALQEVWRPDGGTSTGPRRSRPRWATSSTRRGRAEPSSSPACRLVGRTGESAGTGDWGQALLTRVPRGPVTVHRLRASCSTRSTAPS